MHPLKTQSLNYQTSPDSQNPTLAKIYTLKTSAIYLKPEIPISPPSVQSLVNQPVNNKPRISLVNVLAYKYACKSEGAISF